MEICNVVERATTLVMNIADVANRSQYTQRDKPTAAGDVSRDFDFLSGSGMLHNQKLPQRLADSHDRIEFNTNDWFNLPLENLGMAGNYCIDQWEH